MPLSLIELLHVVRERSDNDLSAEISQKFFNSSKEEVEKKYKEDKDKLDKLERQKANLIKELNDKRKEIARLTRNDGDGTGSHEDSESITDRSSDLRTPRSEDMVTIERLNKKKQALEDKLKEYKRKSKEEKHELQVQINHLKSDIEDKNYKLQSLQDTLVDQFKKDIERLRKSFETTQKQIESNLIREKLKEIEQIK